MCFKSGKSFAELHAAYTQALYEAKALGVDNSEEKVMRILETILDMDNPDKVTKNMTNKYLESNKSFDSFMEELVSGDIPQGVRPEPDISKPFDEEDKEDDDIDGPYNNKLKSDLKDISDLDYNDAV